MSLEDQKCHEAVRVTEDYIAQDEEDELTLRRGDIIRVIEKDNSGWWKGELRGRQGLFPRHAVEPVHQEQVGYCNGGGRVSPNNILWLK